MTIAEIVLTIIWWLVQMLFWTFGCFLFAIWWGQNYILYLPTVGGRAGIRRRLAYNTYTSRSPAEQQIPYQEYFLTTSDNILIHTWFLPHQTHKTTAPTLIFFHGNAGNIGNRLLNAQQIMSDCHVNILLVEYRGFGNSTGTPSEHGFHLDALCSLDYLRSRNDIDTSKIFLFGRSLGGAVAIWLASQRPEHIAGLIVENTFSSIEDMAICMAKNVSQLSGLLQNPTFVKYFRTFLYIFMTSHWRSIDLLPSQKRPTLLLSGLSDELIPPTQMKGLFDVLPSNIFKQFHTVQSGTHNDTYIKGGDEYYRVISKFLKTVSEGIPDPQCVTTHQE